MIVVSVSLILLPLAKGPGLTLAAFGVALTGVPVYVVFVMETPWRLRPVFLDKWSGEYQNVLFCKVIGYFHSLQSL